MNNFDIKLAKKHLNEFNIINIFTVHFKLNNGFEDLLVFWSYRGCVFATSVIIKMRNETREFSFYEKCSLISDGISRDIEELDKIFFNIPGDNMLNSSFNSISFRMTEFLSYLVDIGLFKLNQNQFLNDVINYKKTWNSTLPKGTEIYSTILEQQKIPKGEDLVKMIEALDTKTLLL